MFPSPKDVWGFFATKIRSHMFTFYMWVLLATERQFSNDMFPAPLCHPTPPHWTSCQPALVGRPLGPRCRPPGFPLAMPGRVPGAGGK